MGATDAWEPQPGVPLPPVQGAKADAILAELVSERGAPAHLLWPAQRARIQGQPGHCLDAGW